MRKNKKFKSFLLFIAVGLILQFSVLYFINDFILVKRNISKTVKFKEVSSNDIPEKDVPIDLPEEAQDIQVSYNSNYVSYIQNDELKVINTHTGVEKTVVLPKHGSISCYRWVPDNQRIYIAHKKKLRTRSQFSFFFYDANKDDLDQVKHFAEETILTLKNRNAEVKDIKISHLTGMVLLKIKNYGNSKLLYKLDRMNNLYKLKVTNNNVDDVDLMLNKDSILYKTSSNNRIYILENKHTKKIKIKDADSLTILNTNKDNTVYLGELKNHKISTIYYKTFDDDADKDNDNTKDSNTNYNMNWTKINLPHEVNKKDIYFDNNKIYINDSLKGTVTELKTNKVTKYYGNILGIYDSKILCVSDSKVRHIQINN